MAYRRYANLPGTQQYGLTRRKQRTTEEFEYNPNLSRASLSPDPSPASRSLAVSEAGGPSSIAIPGLEAEAVEPAGPPADPTETPMTANQQLAMNLTVSEYGSSLIGKGLKGYLSDTAIAAIVTGKVSFSEALKGMVSNVVGSTNPVIGPIELALKVKNFVTSYNENLANIELAESKFSPAETEEAVSESQHQVFGQHTDPTLAEPQHQAFGEPQPEAYNEPQNLAFGSKAPTATSGEIAEALGEESFSNPDIDSIDVLGGYVSGTSIGIGDPGPDPDATGAEAAGEATTGGLAEAATGDGDSGDPTVLCTALYNMGRLDEKIYKADSEYADKYVDDLTYAGYAVWARHLAKSKWIVLLLSPLIKFLAKEMAFRFRGGESNFIGRVIINLGIPACKLIGKLMEIGNVRWNSFKRTMRCFVQEKGLGIRAASREVEKLTDGLVKASRADKVYRDRTATNVAPKTPPGETCTISDLYGTCNEYFQVMF